MQLTHQDELLALYKIPRFQPIQIHPARQSPGIPIQFMNSSRPQFRNQPGDFFTYQVVTLFDENIIAIMTELNSNHFME